MFDSTILDVALGLIFTFLTVSLIASVAVEAISSALKWRSSHLLEGIKQLVNDPEFTGLARALYQHAAVNPRGIPSRPSAAAANAAGATGATGAAGAADPVIKGARVLMAVWSDWFAFKALRPTKGGPDLRSSPAYVEPAQFAAALMDILGLTGAGAPAAAPNTAVAAMKQALDALLNPVPGPMPAPIQADPQIHQLLTGIVERCRGDLAAVQTEIAGWFDNGMDRLSGEYKRRTQLVSFAVALLITGLINADAIQVAHALYRQPALVKDLTLPSTVSDSLAGAATTPATPTPMAQAAEDALKVLDEHLPIGWEGEQSWPKSTEGRLYKLLGWIITAGATLFGAPFWFDSLQAIIRLRGSGPSPDEKTKNRAAV